MLADMDAQAGIDTAGQRINQLQTEYAKISTATVVVRVGDRDQVQIVGRDGQTSFFQIPQKGAIWTAPGEAEPANLETSWQPDDLFSSSVPSMAMAQGSESQPLILGFPDPAPSAYRYPIRPDVPRQFKTQNLPEDSTVTEEECAKRFVLKAEDLFDMLVKHDKVKVQKRTIEIFTQALQMELAFAPPSRDQMRQIGQRELLRSGYFHPKDLRAVLLRRLKLVLLERGVEDATDPEILAEYLDVLLSTRPELLREAQKAALAQGAVIEDAETLPLELATDGPLARSRLNIYNAVPPGLNGWERSFGDSLDSDATDTVLWWHRNPVNKPWSVKVLLVDGRGFYPDFIIGIRHRKTECSGLLADTKYAYDTNKELPKILAEHPSYGRVLILAQNNSKQWAMAELQSLSGKATLGNVFRLAEATGY
jgi:hypothetical protein